MPIFSAPSSSRDYRVWAKGFGLVALLFVFWSCFDFGALLFIPILIIFALLIIELPGSLFCIQSTIIDKLANFFASHYLRSVLYLAFSLLVFIFSNPAFSTIIAGIALLLCSLCNLALGIKARNSQSEV